MTDRFDRRQILALATLLPLGGCSGLTRLVETPPPLKLYHLTPASEFSAGLPRAPWQLLVETPIANTVIDTARIALGETSNQLTYYSSASWVDTAPEMVQLLLIESFEKSNRIVSVGREATGLRADFMLKTDLRDFQADYAGQPPETTAPAARVRLTAKLVRMPRRTIVASDTFEAAVVAASPLFVDVIAAFDKAFTTVARRVVEWTLRQGAANFSDNPPS